MRVNRLKTNVLIKKLVRTLYVQFESIGLIGTFDQ